MTGKEELEKFLMELDVPEDMAKVLCDMKKFEKTIDDIKSIERVSESFTVGNIAEYLSALNSNANIDVKFKKMNIRAQAPQRAHEHDAGFDLVATSIVESDQYIQYGVGLSFDIPPGYAMFLFPRSSVSKKNLCLANCVGVIDSTYRGEVAARFRVTREVSRSESFSGDPLYRVGDRVVQAIILKLPQVEFTEVDNLSDTIRGSGSFGSSGN